MGIPLRVIGQPASVFGPAEPGDCWRWHANEHNQGWVVALPDGGVLVTHQDPGVLFTTGPRWTVAGEPPHLDVGPVIESAGGWRGVIRDGELADA